MADRPQHHSDSFVPAINNAQVPSALITPAQRRRLVARRAAREMSASEQRPASTSHARTTSLQLQASNSNDANDHYISFDEHDTETLVDASDLRHASMTLHSSPIGMNSAEMAELDVLAEQISVMSAEVAHLRLQARERYGDQPSSYRSTHGGVRGAHPITQLQPSAGREGTHSDTLDSAAQNQHCTSSDKIIIPTAVNKSGVRADQRYTTICSAPTKEVRNSNETEELPRFARPTAATLRRSNETLRKPPPSDNAGHHSRGASQVGTIVLPQTNPTKHRISLLPKRTSLPSSWACGQATVAEQNVAPSIEQSASLHGRQSSLDSHAPIKLPSKKPTYMSPTTATARRAQAKIECPSPTKKAKVVGSSAELPSGLADRLEAMAKAMEAVSAASRSLSMSLNPPTPLAPVLNTTTRRRASSQLLTPIFRKLERRGLLKADVVARLLATGDEAGSPVIDRTMANVDHGSSITAGISRTYASILRSSESRDMPIQPTNQPCVQDVAPKSKMHALEEKAEETSPQSTRQQFPAFDGSSDVNELLIDNGSISGPEGNSGTPSPLLRGTAGSDAACWSASPEGLSIVPEPYHDQFLGARGFTLNARAMDFTPVSTRTSRKRSERQYSRVWASKVPNDVTAHIPEDEWLALSNSERHSIMHARRHKNRTTVAHPKTLQESLHHSVHSFSSFEDALSPDPFGSPSWESPYTPRFNTEAGRRGWKISSVDSGNAVWQGGNGREIRFAGYGPAAERPHYNTYAYSNHDTGALAEIGQAFMTELSPASEAYMDSLARLEAAMARGYPNVPCENYEWSPQGFAYMPSWCDSCAAR